MNIIILIAALLISVVSGLADTLLASLWTITEPVLIILAIGYGADLIAKVYRKAFAEMSAMATDESLNNHAA